MRRERAQRRELSGNVQLAAAQAAKSGRRVFEAKGVDFAYGDRVLVRDFSTIIQRGDKVGRRRRSADADSAFAVERDVDAGDVEPPKEL